MIYLNIKQLTAITFLFNFALLTQKKIKKMNFSVFFKKEVGNNAKRS